MATHSLERLYRKRRSNAAAWQQREEAIDTEPLVFVGIDWASTEHQVCLIGADSPVQRVFAHDADGIGAMVDWLSAQAEQPGQVAVAVETPHRPIVEALMGRGVAVFAINLKQLDRFRDRFSPAGAKDDRRDALVLASSLRTDRHCFRCVEALDPVVVELREWSRMAEELKHERVRLTNRVRQQLWRYYPQMLDLTEDVGGDWFLALWTKAPTPAEAMRLTETKIAKVLSAHRIRRITAHDALAILRRPTLTVAPGTTDAACAHITAVAERLFVSAARPHGYLTKPWLRLWVSGLSPGKITVMALLTLIVAKGGNRDLIVVPADRPSAEP